MFNSWFSSKSSSTSRHSQPPQASSSVKNSPSALKDTQPILTDSSSISQLTVAPRSDSGTITSSQSATPLAEVHSYINDPSIYAPTQSLSTPRKHAEVDTPRTSGEPVPRGFDGKVRDSTAAVTGKKDRVEPETLFTPQDTVIAEVFGRPGVNDAPQPDAAHTTSPHSHLHPPQASASLLTSDTPPFPPSNQTAPSSAPAPSARPGPTITIYDPFSGIKLGEHTPITPSKAAQGEFNPAYTSPTTGDPKLWAHLERILELQAEIAAMHADMEVGVGRSSGNTGGISGTGGMGRAAETVGLGLGAGIRGGGGGSTGANPSEGGKARPTKRMMRRETLPIGDDDEPGPEGGAASGAATDASIDHSDDEDDDADDEEDDIHGYGKKRRDEEFARLAEQFAERKEAIGGIMNKLDDLSTTLKAFHALPMPIIDLATSTSRANTMSSTASNISKASSSPAQGLHFGQPSSPLSPFSPSNVGTSFSPHGAALPADTSFSIPGPPPPTLAPPISSTAGPRIREPITTAAPPRGPSPKIVAEAQQVESPIDMHPIQSAFRGAVVG